MSFGIAAIDAVQAGYEGTAEQGFATEARLFGEMAATAVSRELIFLFFATTSLKKDTGVGEGSPAPLPVSQIGILGTGFMGAGIAVSQPAFPSLVRDWFPRRIAIATAVYSNGILIGETVPTGLTSPVGVLPLAHGDWRWAIATWSVVVLISGLAIVLSVPRRGQRPAVPARWWPSWREGPAVRIGLVMGMASAVYFGTNAYIPDFLDQTGRHSLITPTLFVLNGAQLLTAPAVALRAQLLTGRVGFIGSAVLMAIGQLGIVLTPGAGVIIWAFVLGFAAALAFIVALTLPPRLAAPGDVARMSAAVFTVQYGTAFVLPLVAGSLWDLTGVAALAFAPGVAATAVMAWLATSLRLGGTQGKIPDL